jgi:hypothetical protein
MPRSVRFATHTEGRYISYPTEEDNVAKSYCEEDYMHFKNSMIRDSLRYSHKIYGSRDRNEPLDSKSSKQLIIRCVGIDHLISRDVRERYHAIMQTEAQLVLRMKHDIPCLAQEVETKVAM